MRPRRLIVIAAAVVVVVAVAFAVRFVVFPHSDSIGKADVVVVVDSATDGNKFEMVRKILAVSPQSTVLYSAADGKCDRLRDVATHLVCFYPNPDTTQGEARYAAAYATAHHDSSMAVVVPRPQLSRARIRFSRCWKGSLDMIEAPTSLPRALSQLPYQALATLKAETVQRSC
jgi:predicted GTPase